MAAIEIREQTRPKRLSASLNKGLREMAPEDAKALLSDFADLLVY